MKRLVCILLAVCLAAGLCACAGGLIPAAQQTPIVISDPVTDPPAPTDTPVPAAPEDTPPPQPAVLTLPPAREGWAESYLAFLDDNYDVFAALWPEGLTRVGFIDLDLDGTPEMLVFDQGASATLGVQLFDLVDGRVECVSSVLENAAGAFGGEHFSPVSVCASFFESFRLCQTDSGYVFWVLSANGTMESSWEEIIRFDGENGVLTPVSVCARFVEGDPEADAVLSERYTVAGQEADKAAYEAAEAVFSMGRDTGYEARGVFLWNDMAKYDTTYDGLMAMARDAVEACAPIEVE